MSSHEPMQQSTLYKWSDWDRLINRSFATPHERAALVTAISSYPDVIEKVRSLKGDDAQTFIDVVNEASPLGPISEERDH